MGLFFPIDTWSLPSANEWNFLGAHPFVLMDPHSSRHSTKSQQLSQLSFFVASAMVFCLNTFVIKKILIMSKPGKDAHPAQQHQLRATNVRSFSQSVTSLHPLWVSLFLKQLSLLQSRDVYIACTTQSTFLWIVLGFTHLCSGRPASILHTCAYYLPTNHSTGIKGVAFGADRPKYA